MRKLKLRNYSFKTIKAYLGCLREYSDFKKFNLEKIDEENIKQFLLNKQDKNYSSQARKNIRGNFKRRNQKHY